MMVRAAGPLRPATCPLLLERGPVRSHAFGQWPPRRSCPGRPPRLARNTIIESTFEVGRRFSCTMRVDCGQLTPGAVIRPVPGEWHPRMPERLDEEELADWRAGRNAVYQLAALTIGARLAVADA